jgi:hypothetical protein
VIEGTEADPVLFTSAAATPDAGDWVGLIFQGPPGIKYNQIQNALIEYAGGDSRHSGYSCDTGNPYGDDGAILVAGWKPGAPFVFSSEIRYSASNGFVRGWKDTEGPDFVAGNTFFGIAGCLQTNPRYKDCPPCIKSTEVGSVCH